MEDNQELVVEETTENTEQPTVEETVELTDTEQPKYTDADLDEILAKKINRERKKFEKEYADAIEISNIVKKGINANDLKSAKEQIRNFYEEQGVEVNNIRTDKEEKILGKDDANELLELGLEEAEEEANRLAGIGYNNLSIRDKEKFTTLASALTYEKNKKELKEMGVSEDILEDKSFKEFSSQFNTNTPFNKIYDLYKASQPQKETHMMGSMKGIDNKVESEFYTEEELNNLSLDDLKDPKVWEKARKSMMK